MVVVYRTSLLGAKLRATRMRWEFAPSVSLQQLWGFNPC